jgi:hypothetical protein
MKQRHVLRPCRLLDIFEINKQQQQQQQHMPRDLSARYFGYSSLYFFDAFQHGGLPGCDERTRILLNKQRLLVAPREVLKC